MIKLSKHGWPYGVRKITVSVNSNVYFDDCYIHRFIVKGEWDGIFQDVVITENDYNNWKINK